MGARDAAALGDLPRSTPRWGIGNRRKLSRGRAYRRRRHRGSRS
jgi:hypothetical protein